MIDLKNTPYWSIYMDVFNLHKKFSEPVESDEFWNALVAKLTAFVENTEHRQKVSSLKNYFWQF